MLLCKGKIMVNIDKGYDYFQEAYAVLEKTGTLSFIFVLHNNGRSVAHRHGSNAQFIVLYR